MNAPIRLITSAAMTSDADGDADQSKRADHDFTIGRASTRDRPTATILSVG